MEDYGHDHDFEDLIVLQCTPLGKWGVHQCWSLFRIKRHWWKYFCQGSSRILKYVFEDFCFSLSIILKDLLCPYMNPYPITICNFSQDPRSFKTVCSEILVKAMGFLLCIGNSFKLIWLKYAIFRIQSKFIDSRTLHLLHCEIHVGFSRRIYTHLIWNVWHTCWKAILVILYYFHWCLALHFSFLISQVHIGLTKQNACKHMQLFLVDKDLNQWF